MSKRKSVIMALFITIILIPLINIIINNHKRYDYSNIKNIQTKSTQPYLPNEYRISDESIELEKEEKGKALENGLVITDGINEYVWIEVPNDGSGPDYSNVEINKDGVYTEENYEKIRTALKQYVEHYKQENCEDYWYYQTTKDDKQITYSKDPIVEENQYKYVKDGTLEKNDEILDEDIYTTTGLTYKEYQLKYKKMLKSIYENGGFYIGRYEASIIKNSSELDNYLNSVKNNTYKEANVITQKNCIPYTNLNCNNAMQLAKKIMNNNESYESSILFGLQWDLVMKYLETKLGDNIINSNNENILTENSTEWGNYYESQFVINRGEYAIFDDFNKWYSYTYEREGYIKVDNGISTKLSGENGTSGILLTTGASDTNKKQNIYDLAGNVREMTLEMKIDSESNMIIRGSKHSFIPGEKSYVNKRENWAYGNMCPCLRF